MNKVGDVIEFKMACSGRRIFGRVKRITRNGTLWVDAGYRMTLHTVCVIGGAYVGIS